MSVPLPSVWVNLQLKTKHLISEVMWSVVFLGDQVSFHLHLHLIEVKGYPNTLILGCLCGIRVGHCYACTGYIVLIDIWCSSMKNSFDDLWHYTQWLLCLQNWQFTQRLYYSHCCKAACRCWWWWWWWYRPQHEAFSLYCIVRCCFDGILCYFFCFIFLVAKGGCLAWFWISTPLFFCSSLGFFYTSVCIMESWPLAYLMHKAFNSSDILDARNGDCICF